MRSSSGAGHVCNPLYCRIQRCIVPIGAQASGSGRVLHGEAAAVKLCVCVCVQPCVPRETEFYVLYMQGAGALPGGLLPTKTPPGRGDNVPACIRPHQQPWTRRGSWVLVGEPLRSFSPLRRRQDDDDNYIFSP